MCLEERLEREGIEFVVVDDEDMLAVARLCSTCVLVLHSNDTCFRLNLEARIVVLLLRRRNDTFDWSLSLHLIILCLLNNFASRLVRARRRILLGLFLFATLSLVGSFLQLIVLSWPTLSIVSLSGVLVTDFNAEVSHEL